MKRTRSGSLDQMYTVPLVSCVKLERLLLESVIIVGWWHSRYCAPSAELKGLARGVQLSFSIPVTSFLMTTLTGCTCGRVSG